MRVTVSVKPSGGDFDSPAAALAAITDASPDKHYTVRIWPKGGGWPVNELATKDYVDLEGVGEAWLRGYQPPSASAGVWGDVSVNSAVRVESESTLRNLRITAQNMRYAAHIDGPTMAGKAMRFEGVTLEHLGNEEVRAYWKAQGFEAQIDSWGSEHYVWQSMCAAGMGMWPGSSVSYRNCQLRSPKGATLFCHTHNGAAAFGSYLEVEDTTVESMSKETALMLQSFASGQPNMCRIARSRIIGGASATVQTGTEQEWLIVHDQNVGLQDVAGAAARQLWAARPDI